MPKILLRRFGFSALLAGMFLAGMKVPSAPAQTPVASGTQPSNIVHPAYPNGNRTPLGQQIAAVLADPVMARAHWGIAVTALDGTPLYGLEEGKLFRPASNAKLFTTATAMARLPIESSVLTTASLEKPEGGISRHGISVDQSKASGCHYIASVDPTPVGDGEYPAISRQGVTAPYDGLQFIDELAAKIAQLGVTRIDGDITWSDDEWHNRYPAGWAIEDMPWGYGAPVSEVLINDNQMAMTVTPREHTSVADVRFSPDVNYYQLDRSAQVLQTPGSPDVEVEMTPDSRSLRVTGHILPEPSAGSKERPYITQIAINDPAQFAAQALKMKLIQRGVHVSGEAKSAHRGYPTTDFAAQSRKPLPPPADPNVGYGCSGSSPGVGANAPVMLSVNQTTTTSRNEDVVFTMKHSQNLRAERLLRRLGDRLNEEVFVRGLDPSEFSTDTNAQGARVVRQFLIDVGLDGGDFFFYDGSGLSTKDLVAPRATAQLLAFATKQPWFSAWKAGLPIGGVDGTLAGRFKEAPLKGHVFAKTGTLGESRALSGYLDCASGRQVIFSVMVDNHAPGVPDRAAMDKIVAAIAANN